MNTTSYAEVLNNLCFQNFLMRYYFKQTFEPRNRQPYTHIKIIGGGGGGGGAGRERERERERETFSYTAKPKPP